MHYVICKLIAKYPVTIDLGCLDFTKDKISWMFRSAWYEQ